MRSLLVALLLARAAVADPPQHQDIAPATLEQLRIAGERSIPPDQATRRKIIADHKSGATTTFVLCIDEHGNPSSTELLKSSGYAEWDDKVRAAMLDAWRFRPYEHDGKAVRACAAITQLYKNPNPPPSGKSV